jgi:hypothetical protein
MVRSAIDKNNYHELKRYFLENAIINQDTKSYKLGELGKKIMKLLPARLLGGSHR